MTDADVIKALERMATNDLYNGDMQTASICLHAKETIERQKAEIERLEKQKTIFAKQFYKMGVVELAERLKAVAEYDDVCEEYSLHPSDIDNLEKEMVGDNNEN